MSVEIDTVAQLIEALRKLPPESIVLGSWEGVFESISVYRDKQGRCILDADGCRYERDYSDGTL